MGAGIARSPSCQMDEQVEIDMLETGHVAACSLLGTLVFIGDHSHVTS